jgi:ribosomal protein S18 acetylase RimI-like enzyme
MKIFLNRLKEKDIINRIQNKFFIRIGLFKSSNISGSIPSREIDNIYAKKQINFLDERLLKEYASKHRGNNHYEENILPRLTNHNRFKAFGVIDMEKDEIAYLCWVDFDKITIPEINFIEELHSKEAYFLDDHCVNEHQRKGLHSAMFNERFLYCKRRGVKAVFIVIFLNNSRALQTLKKYNFKIINKFLFYPFLK